MNISKEIITLLKDEARKENQEYNNPNFLIALSDLLEIYYNFEDDDVNKYIHEMFSR